MIIEINKDIDRYQESVALGLTARQLIFSAASVAVGGGLVLLLYRYIGLTASAYVAIPCVAPIAMQGFYSYNGMSFYEYMGRKIHFMFSNFPLTYISTESEAELQKIRNEDQTNGTSVLPGFITGKKKEKRTEFDEKFENEEWMPEALELAEKKDKEDFEEMKKKMKKTLIGTVIGIVLAVIGTVAYKYFRG